MWNVAMPRSFPTTGQPLVGIISPSMELRPLCKSQFWT